LNYRANNSHNQRNQYAVEDYYLYLLIENRNIQLVSQTSEESTLLISLCMLGAMQLSSRATK